MRSWKQLTFDLFRASPTPSSPVVAREKDLSRLTGIVTDSALRQKAAQLLAQVGCEDLARCVQVVWNSRLTTTAGLAHYRDCKVTLNPRLREFGDNEVDRTLRHELAHLVAHFRAGRRRISPHGREWKKACHDLGLPDEKRTHDLPLPRRKIEKRLIYRCCHCQKTYPRVRPFTRASACLSCCRAYNNGQFSTQFQLRLASVNASEES